MSWQGRYWYWSCGCWVIDTPDDKVMTLHACGDHRNLLAHTLVLAVGDPTLGNRSELLPQGAIAEDP